MLGTATVFWDSLQQYGSTAGKWDLSDDQSRAKTTRSWGNINVPEMSSFDVLLLCVGETKLVCPTR